MSGITIASDQRALRVAVLSYPMLYQRTGGLQVQIIETIDALRTLGVEARLVDPNTESLSGYDVVHVFSAINGNHRIVETAKSVGCKVVLSPLVRPSWTRWTGLRESMIERLVGKLSGWHVQTSYAQIKTALTLSDKIVALGDIERNSIIEAFGIPAERVVVVENGVTQRFFDATPDEFRKRYGIDGKFVLNVAAVNPHKNQRALVQALAGEAVTIVLIGECLKEDQAYLASLTSQPNVRYLGKLAYGDTVLCSAYAAATVFALPSMNEVMPLSVMEALAAGTPAVMTNQHSMRLPATGTTLLEHNPTDVAALRRLLLASLAEPAPAAECKQVVDGLRWTSVAKQLISAYQEVLGPSSAQQAAPERPYPKRTA